MYVVLWVNVTVYCPHSRVVSFGFVDVGEESFVWSVCVFSMMMLVLFPFMCVLGSLLLLCVSVCFHVFGVSVCGHMCV